MKKEGRRAGGREEVGKEGSKGGRKEGKEMKGGRKEGTEREERRK